MNQYEMAARSNKVDKLIAALDVECGQRCTEADLHAAVNGLPMMRSMFVRAVERAGINPPSQTTIDLLVVRIRERDKIASSRA